MKTNHLKMQKGHYAIMMAVIVLIMVIPLIVNQQTVTRETNSGFYRNQFYQTELIQQNTLNVLSKRTSDVLGSAVLQNCNWPAGMDNALENDLNNFLTQLNANELGNSQPLTIQCRIDNWNSANSAVSNGQTVIISMDLICENNLNSLRLTLTQNTSIEKQVNWQSGAACSSTVTDLQSGLVEATKSN